MTQMGRSKLTVLALLGLGAAVGYLGPYSQQSPQPNAMAREASPDDPAAKSAPAVSPVKARSDRDTYYPNTEDLAPNEMRLIACGTGMPTTRAFQAAA